VEDAVVNEIIYDESESVILIERVPDRPGAAAIVFSAIASGGLNIDTIAHVGSTANLGRTDLLFSLPSRDGARAIEILQGDRERIGFERVALHDRVGKITLIGSGLKSHPAVAARFFAALAAANLNIQIISTSEIRIAIFADRESCLGAMQLLRREFGLSA